MKLSSLKKRLLLFLLVFGPATITAISDNDAAGVATYSLAGAQFGYSMLFVLFYVTLLLGITQEMGIRIAIVTGKGLGDIIREKYGIVVSMVVFLALSLANMGSIVANFAALKTTTAMFHIPTVPFMVLIIVFSFLFVSKGNYITNQRLFLLGMVLYFAYVISAVKGSPDWEKAFVSVFVPTDLKLSGDFIFSAIAVLGTTITPWGQFFVQSYLLDKKISLEKLKYVQFETFFGAFLTNFFSFFMIVATAATLFAHKIPLTSGEEAALAIRPFAGELAGILFGVGLLNAAIMGIIIISLTTAYAFSEFFGLVGSLDVPFVKGKPFYIIFITQLIIACLIALIPSVNLFKIVLVTQSVNGILLPVIFYFLLNITNDKELMGRYTNKKWYNYFAIISSALIIIASLFTMVSFFL